MTCLLRMLGGAILGALFGLAVGIGVAGVVLLLDLPNEDPLDRWDSGVPIFVLLVGSGTLVGLIAGLASRASEHGLPFLKSATVVAIAGIVTTPIALSLPRGMFLLAPLAGIILGGIAVVWGGIVRTHTIRTTKRKGESTVNKA